MLFDHVAVVKQRVIAAELTSSMTINCPNCLIESTKSVHMHLEGEIQLKAINLIARGLLESQSITRSPHGIRFLALKSIEAPVMEPMIVRDLLP